MPPAHLQGYCRRRHPAPPATAGGPAVDGRGWRAARRIRRPDRLERIGGRLIWVCGSRPRSSFRPENLLRNIEQQRRCAGQIRRRGHHGFAGEQYVDQLARRRCGRWAVNPARRRSLLARRELHVMAPWLQPGQRCRWPQQGVERPSETPGGHGCRRCRGSDAAGGAAETVRPVRMPRRKACAAGVIVGRYRPLQYVVGIGLSPVVVPPRSGRCCASAARSCARTRVDIDHQYVLSASGPTTSGCLRVG